MSEITREQFVKAWKAHTAELIGLVLQAPDAYFQQELAAFQKIEAEANAMIERVAAQKFPAQR